jgi:hypothetical protein
MLVTVRPKLESGDIHMQKAPQKKGPLDQGVYNFKPS